jgi:pyruvate,water dikinase
MAGLSEAEPSTQLRARALEVIGLDDPAAQDPAVSGAKAANLAIAAARGIAVLPGLVVTTAATHDGRLARCALGPLKTAFHALGGDEDVRFVVRSSSTAEDLANSSMAGQFTSVLGVRGWAALLDAVETVLRSGQRREGSRPMAVLVQPQLETHCGGVLFGLDPVVGDTRHLVIEAVEGTPDSLVSGRANAVHCVVSPTGRLIAGGSARQRQLLPRRRRRKLANLARHAAAAFGGPQDVEWAVSDDRRLWLLQSRPVTAVAEPVATHGPIFGTGPVAETFPDPLRPLEVSLWIDPLRDGIAGALQVTGAVARRHLHRSPVAIVVGGRVALDLELLGIAPRRRSGWRVLNPAPAARRLVAAWRVGRLRAALPALIGDVLEDVDAELTSLGDLDDLDADALIELLVRARDHLVALHAYEVMAGMLLHSDETSSLASIAVAALGEARAEGLTDREVVATRPVTLALVPPSIAGAWRLPAAPATSAGQDLGVGGLGPRDALRLRCRWVQEVGAIAAERLGTLFALDGKVDEAAAITELSLDEIRAAWRGEFAADRKRSRWAAGPPLPPVFRLTSSGSPVAVRRSSHSAHDGLPTSAGRAVGVARHDPAGIRDGEPAVLITDTLDPRLAPVLPSVVGLVSETGSALSHLAILAREMHVPTVVAVPDARARFPVGTRVLVDGRTGEVSVIEADEGGQACSVR